MGGKSGSILLPFYARSEHLLCLWKEVIQVLVCVLTCLTNYGSKNCLFFVFFGKNNHPFIVPLMVFWNIMLHPQTII